MQERTFIATLLHPHIPLEAIICHPILLLKPDSLTANPLSYFGHLVDVINFKDIGTSYDFDGAFLCFLFLRWDLKYFKGLFISFNKKPVEVFGTFGFLLGLDNMALVEIGKLSDLRTHSQEI
jgi:hypothetical protein